MYGKRADGSKKSDTFFEELWASQHPEEAKQLKEEEEKKKEQEKKAKEEKIKKLKE